MSNRATTDHEDGPPETEYDNPVARSKCKTAVIVIHGMGEQWPMDTLRRFVDAAWRYDKNLNQNWSKGETYSKPEAITGSFELRRLTTRYWKPAPGDDDPVRRVDFFEFYWAHLMQGNSIGAVMSWLLRLLVRKPGQVPRRLLGGWIAGLFILFAGIALALLTAVKPDLSHFGIPTWGWAMVAAIGGGFSALWLRPVAGDAARYLSPSPDNVAARQMIREAGIDLLAKIQDTGEYDRIVVAGHSLGSVIGYDILHYAWGRLDREALIAAHRGNPACQAALAQLERVADKLDKTPNSGEALSAYRDAQRNYRTELARIREAPPVWLVSDFVTMGSPLSNADVLLAKDRKDLDARIALRDQPACPPQSERGNRMRFTYESGGEKIPHHGAVFAPTVWSNIYYPNVLGLIGDFISGPVAPLLGPGIRDIRVPIGAPVFRHLSYWARADKNGAAIRALRHALNLRDHDETAIWGLLSHDLPVRAEELPVAQTNIEVQA
ncbi:hypothetical protein S2M10_30810 [Sphingomonas sp. S2M10]|uniref:hypothetical protein n=1 Tax=Sphingomonas sp. S2M10 TaxID=2705010 RepID=UPI00145671F2|nr:hypothetical protein [Sphingomonas sp. S2M10]NLS28075.1 hypothetical protein [Sphingomonas sp. S2M10]